MAGDLEVRRRAALSRRTLLAGAMVSAWPAVRAAGPELAAAVRAWAGGAEPRDGRVTLEVATLVDNGNAVPVTVRVQSPMTEADHVREIALFNEKNPQRDVLRVALGPASGRAEVSTRIRLATSQQLVALARLSDGSVWQQRMNVIVTLAACIEGG